MANFIRRAFRRVLERFFQMKVIRLIRFLGTLIGVVMVAMAPIWMPVAIATSITFYITGSSVVAGAAGLGTSSTVIYTVRRYTGTS